MERDPFVLEARRHGSAVGEWSALVADVLGLPGPRIERVRLAGQLHDIGKVEVPRAILSKPGPLTEEEWIVMRRHPEHGARILWHSFFDDMRPWVLHHHERIDGTGYPHGLRGDDIPLEARIIAVCDAWCAMTSDRPYRAAMPDRNALEELARGAGTQFDPVCAAALDALVERRAKIVSESRPGLRDERQPALAAAHARLVA